MRRHSAPALVYVVGITSIVLVPLVIAVFLAFTDFSAVEAPRWVGLGNVRRLLSDRALARALGNTLIFAAIAVPLRLVGALGLALLLHRDDRWSSAGRVAAYLPSVVPEIAFVLAWGWLLNPLFGPFAGWMPHVLNDVWGARVAVGVVAGFQVGEGFLIALAFRRSLSSSMYDVAAVEGATPWVTLRSVTLPAMLPVLALLAVRDVLLAMQVSAVPALVLTDGGPREATTTVPLYLYDAAFRYFRLGYANAVSVSMSVLTALVVFVAYRLSRRWV